MGVELPPDIADILDPISEEEDAALVKAMEEGLESELVSEECVMAILRGEDEIEYDGRFTRDLRRVRNQQIFARVQRWLPRLKN